MYTDEVGITLGATMVGTIGLRDIPLFATFCRF